MQPKTYWKISIALLSIFLVVLLYSFSQFEFFLGPSPLDYFSGPLLYVLPTVLLLVLLPVALLSLALFIWKRKAGLYLVWAFCLLSLPYYSLRAFQYWLMVVSQPETIPGDVLNLYYLNLSTMVSFLALALLLFATALKSRLLFLGAKGAAVPKP